MDGIKIWFVLLIFVILCGCSTDYNSKHYNEVNSGISEVIDPCGDGPGHDEILLVFDNGNIVAWYKDLGLAYLEPGVYQTTDAQACVFTVTEDKEVIYE